MSDIDLTLLPQSRFSFRLGFSHNNMTGPSYSSVHEGTDALLLQDWNTTMNSYRFGVDWKAAPRTVISYDQFLNYYKGDTDFGLASFAPALLSNGNPVELGLVDRHCEQRTLQATRSRSDCRRSPDQCHLQRLLQLFAEPADSYQHTHRAAQFAQQLLPAVRPGRILFLQFRRHEHAIGRESLPV
jgi:hypothetical protein